MQYTIEILRDHMPPITVEHEFTADPTTIEVNEVVNGLDIDLSNWNGQTDYYPSKNQPLPEYMNGSEISLNETILEGTGTCQMLFTEKDLIDFGDFVLSRYREALVRNIHNSQHEVSDADVHNWKLKYSEEIAAV